ncbi:MAG: hypothetical protein FWH22_10085 [Fibromonadales bacterium]|nr:hypothetical protein [Fibromonadales bacterium]
MKIRKIYLAILAFLLVSCASLVKAAKDIAKPNEEQQKKEEEPTPSPSPAPTPTPSEKQRKTAN